MLDVSTPTMAGPSPQDLGSAPPQPPIGTGPRGISPLVGTPHAAVLQGLNMMEQGSALITSILKGLSPVMMDAVDKLRMTLPRALAEMSAAGMGGEPSFQGAPPLDGVPIGSPPGSMLPTPLGA